MDKKSFNKLKSGDNISYIYFNAEKKEIYIDIMSVKRVVFSEQGVNFDTVVILTNSPDISIGFEERHFAPQEDIHLSERGPILLSTNDADIHEKYIKLQAALFQTDNLRKRQQYSYNLRYELLHGLRKS